MDDILNTLDDQELNELAAEPLAPPVNQQPPSQPAGPMPPQPQAMPAQPRPTLRNNVYQVPVRRPMMRPQAPAQINQAPPAQTPPAPVTQPMPLSPPPQPVQAPPSLAPPVPVNRPAPNFQPQQPAPSQIGSMPALNTKTKTPKGIYGISGLAALELLIAFLTANTSVLYTIAMVLALMLAVGLLTKLDLARRAALVFQVVNVAVVILVIIGLMGADSRINQLTLKYNDAVAQASLHATPQQEVTIDNLNTQMNKEHRTIGKAIGIDYVRSSLAIFISGGIIWYLKRPDVKAAFH